MKNQVLSAVISRHIRRTRTTGISLLSGLLLFALLGVRWAEAGQKPALPATPRTAPPQPICANCSADPLAFTVRSYQGRSRCLDYTPGEVGSSVFISDCQAAHPVVVEELADGKHTAVLHAGSLVIGIPYGVVRTQGGTPPPVAAETPLQLLKLGTTTLSGNHFFALDGDSIILASDHDLVAKVQNGRGAVKTPVVLGSRNLTDNEFWDFVATDGSGRDPTRGFVRISTKGELLNTISEINQVAKSNNGAAWGSVIRIIDSGQPINLTDNTAVICDPNAYICDTDGSVHSLVVPTGVTIRGDRRGVLPGPALLGVYKCPKGGYCEDYNMFHIQGDDVRITGLRLQGPTDCVVDPSGCHKTFLADVDSIQVGSIDASELEPTGVLIDHNELLEWMETVRVYGNRNLSDKEPCDGLPDLALNDRVHVDRNFIHHNENNDGYGVMLGNGGTGTIRGNTFLMNRHSIAGDGDTQEQYAAWSNLVLSNVPVYGRAREQDFDMHGDIEDKGHHDGWFAGSEVDVVGNTFLGGNRNNFELRGQPCNAMDRFSLNVSMDTYPIYIYGFDGTTANYVPITGPVPSSTPYVDLAANQYAPTNPANRLGVGDFDGDGLDDLFLATGAAWYYSPAGKAEWRFLSAKTDTIGQLLFGDFDGDGRTDVVAIHDGKLVVSWGGISDWELLNANPAPGAITDMAASDFLGDPRSDIFFTDGERWYVSDGGQKPFLVTQTSHFRVKDLRFGDFDDDGKTDVFGVVSGKWQFSKSAMGSWTPLQNALVTDINSLIVADFNGDGYADVGANCADPGCWRISYRGNAGWNYIRQPVGLVGAPLAGVGHFLGHVEADVLSWNVSDPYWMCDPKSGQDTQFCISVGAIEPTQHYSTQDMR